MAIEETQIHNKKQLESMEEQANPCCISTLPSGSPQGRRQEGKSSGREWGTRRAADRSMKGAPEFSGSPLRVNENVGFVVFFVGKEREIWEWRSKDGRDRDLEFLCLATEFIALYPFYFIYLLLTFFCRKTPAKPNNFAYTYLLHLCPCKS